MKRLEDIIASVARILKPAEKLTVAQWAQRHRYINMPGAYVGLWSADKTPYMVEPLEVLTSLDYTAMVFAGPARTGKALALDTPIPTPTGWTTMGELRIGDQLFDEHGSVCRVTNATEIMSQHQCYDVVFDDGSNIVADADHKWFVHDIYGAKKAPYGEKVITTEEMSKKWRITKANGNYRSRYAIPVTKPLSGVKRLLPIDPYTLGVWLGDGANHTGYLTLNKSDAPEILARINASGMIASAMKHEVNGHAVCCGVHGPKGETLISMLKRLDLSFTGDGKFIPEAYLRASEDQRRELVKGLMDTDGTVDNRQPTFEFVTVFPRLRDDISELLNSLGIKHTVAEKEPYYVKDTVKYYCKTAYRITFTSYEPEQVWSLSRQITKARLTLAGRRIKPSQINRRWIRAVKPVESVPVRCITVDSDNHLFLAGRGMIPTHNSDAFWSWAGYSAHNDPTDMILYAMTQGRASELGKGDWSKFVRAKRPNEERSLMQSLLVPGKQNVLDKHFANGMQLMIRWPSITELSGKTVARAWLEDYDRINSPSGPDDIDNQGAAFDLARKRTTTYKRFAMTGIEGSPGFEVEDLNWIASSPHEAPPTTGILGVYNHGDRRRWYWRCPDCEEAFEPTFTLFTYPEYGDNLERAEQVGLMCPNCGVVHGPERKGELNRNGRWLKEGETWNRDGTITGKPRRSEIASFWMQGPAAGFQDWKSIVLNYLNAMDEYTRTGSMGALKKCQNTDMGVPFVPPRNEMARLPEVLKSRAEDWGSGQEYESRSPTVPPWVRFLVATVDVQLRSFVVQITGFGEYGEMTIVDAFKIRHSNRVDENHPARPLLPVDPAGYAEDWDLLIEHVIEKTYPLSDASGRMMPIKITGCDSGGRDGVTPNAIRFYLNLQNDKEGRQHHRRFHLLKGDKVKEGMWLRQTSFYEGKGNATMSFFTGKVPFQRLNSNALKDRLNVILMRDDPGGARMRFPMWLPMWAYTQLCAEERLAGKGWEPPKGKPRNETFDCSYYAIALAVHPDINMDRIKWDEPDRVPGWAKPWDSNDFIIQPESKVSFVKKKADGKSLSELASDWV